MKKWLFLLILAALPLQAEIEVFAKIEGIEGKTGDRNHEGWIKVLSFQHENTRWSRGGEAFGLPREGGSKKRGRLVISHALDAADPQFYQACGDGKHFRNVLINAVDNKDKKKRVYYHLQSSTLDSVQLIRDKRGKLTERLTFVYSDLDWVKERKLGKKEKTFYQRRTY